MKRMHYAASLAAFLLVACSSAPPSPVPTTDAPKAAAKPDDTKKDEAKAKADAKKQKQKELRGKQRDLEQALVENQVAEMDRGVRQWNIDAALRKTTDELEHANKALKVFLEEVKPRELDERKMALDQSTYHAEHQKDELSELTAMYDADEFARTTKELVLKRGRRSLEMAERQLALTKREQAHFENVVLPQRERELRQKVSDAELERKKAEVEANKAKLEFAQAVKRANLRVADLQEEIAELEKALAEDKA